MKWQDISDINLLRKAYGEFDDYILSNQLYIKQDIFEKLQNLSSNMNKLLVAYKNNEQGLYE
jgi:hypothetical protein